MSNQTLNLSEDLYTYLQRISLRADPVLEALRAETSELPGAIMQIAPEQGQFMHLLARIAGVRKALEIGVYTGYSALCVARALPEGGQLIACDINAAWTSVARRYWARAGVADKIDLRLKPALETLQNLRDEGTFDFSFIDADKENYGAYFDLALELAKPGGLILIDNVLWSGKVADADVGDPDTCAIRALNRRLHEDSRIDLVTLPLGDGLTIAVKRQTRGAGRHIEAQAANAGTAHLPGHRRR
jgi:predicted O-methyltransferase YrrM